MLILPIEFQNRIINRYGEEGKIWLKNIDNIVNKYIRQFELEDIHLVNNLSLNVVLFAKSHVYGDLVIKIGTPGQTAISEINIMKYYSSNYAPKCYFSSTDDKVIILERLTPGYSLANLNDLEQRIKVFSNLSNHLLIAANDNENFLTFEENFRKKVEYANKNKVDFEDILPMIDIANNLYQKIKELHLPKYILHHDLHHKNILKTKKRMESNRPTRNYWRKSNRNSSIYKRRNKKCRFRRK